MAILKFFSSPSKMEMNEPNVCKLSFLAIKKLLNPVNHSFDFLVPISHPQQIPTRHLRIKNITPQKQNQALVPKMWRPWEPQIMALEEGWGKGWLEALVASTLYWSLKAKKPRTWCLTAATGRGLGLR